MLASPLAPLLLYLATGACLLWLTGRFVRRLGRWWALGLLLLPLCMTGPALLTGSAYGPIESAYRGQPFSAVADELGVGDLPQPILHDLYTMILPGHQASRHAWTQGEWPLWNPFVLGGQPLAGAGQPAPFYPPNILSLLLSPALAIGFLASLHFLLAALGGFLLARELGCRPATALFGAVGWMAMNGTAFWIGWPLGAAMLLLPLVWLSIRRLVREPGWSACLLAATVNALGLLSGHPETTAHHLWLGGGIWIWELLRRPRSEWWRIARFTAAAGGLVAGLTAIFVLPLLDALVQTREWALRGHPGHLPETSWSETLRRGLGHLVPFVQDFPPRGRPAGESFFSSLPGPYAGSVLLAPAIYGLFSWRRPERWLLVTVAVLGFVAGCRTPGFYIWLESVPLLDRSINDRLIAATGLALVLFAALGLEEWLRRDRPSRLGWIAAGLMVPMVATAAGLWWPLFRWWQKVGGDLDPATLTLRMGLWLLPLAFTLPVLLEPRARCWALPVLMVLLVGQRTVEIGSYYPVAPPERFYPPVAPLDVEFPSDKIYRVTGAGGTLLPAQGIYYGLEDIRGYDAISHPRYAGLTSLWVDDPPRWFNRLSRLDNPVLSLLNVRWVLVPRGEPMPDGWRLTRSGPTVNLWRNLDVLDRAFVPERIRFVDSPGQILDQMSSHDDFAALAWIEPPGTPPPPQERANGRGSVTLVRDGLGFRLAAAMEEPGWVVISNIAWRGWRARSDGEELPLGIADYSLLALELPAGEHQVELFFRPRSFEIGLGITAATTVGLFLALVLTRLRSRRRSPEEPA